MIMHKGQTIARGFLVTCVTGLLAACSGVTGPDGSAADGTSAARAGVDGTGTPATGSGILRLRCEVRPGRSKISVDGNNLTPRNGTFSARVTAGDVTFASRTETAVDDEVEFDFDSEPDDIQVGATAIPATFIVARPGDDVRAEILDAQGAVVASAGGDCRID
jgi:hypothetical protein